MTSMFRSLAVPNYRIWFAGALVSNTGTWMQRTAQDWIVLTDLTDHDATAVGVTMALQFGPQLVLMPLSGLVADRFDRRHVLLVTQLAMGVLGALLGVLTLSGLVVLWEVYAFALLLGVAAAFDAPVRQSFVSELVPNDQLPNAVALNSASFNGARLFGPAVAGLLVAVVGAGWVFMLNGLTFAGTICALLAIRPSGLQPAPRLARKRGQIRDGFRYVRSRSDIVVILVLIAIIGTFGVNFPIYTSTMATVAFHKGAGEFGVLSSVMAVGSLAGALLSARRERPRMRIIVAAATAFGVTCTLAALAPTYLTFGIALALVGLSSLTLMTSANAYVQSTTSPAVRGRVMALYMAIFMGGTPIGAPLVGWVANVFGPRWAIGVGAASGFVGAAIAVGWLLRTGRVRVSMHEGRPHVHVGRPDPEAITGQLATVEAASER